MSGRVQIFKSREDVVGSPGSRSVFADNLYNNRFGEIRIKKFNQLRTEL